MQKRHASEKDIYVRGVLGYFFVSDFCEWRETPDSRATVSFPNASRLGQQFLQSEIIGGVCEENCCMLIFFFFDKQDKLLHVSGLFFSFPKMNYTLPSQSARASVPGSALRFLILRNDSTGCQTKQCTRTPGPKQSHAAQPKDLTHGRQTFLLSLEYLLSDFCTSLSPRSRFLAQTYSTWPCL